jgi:hypothetical protein
MSASLRALLARIIDYAGLFPPANLPLDRAIRNYARHRKGAEQWILGRFIVGATRLPELAAFDTLFEENPPFHFAVLGRGGKTADELQQGFNDDLASIAEFRQRHVGRVEVDVLEVKLPDDLLKPQNHQAACYTLVRLADLVEAYSPAPLKPFYEIGLAGDWRICIDNGAAVLHHLTDFARARLLGAYQRYRPAGFKVRCAGQTSLAFPSPEQVAHVVVACRDRGLALKATAGLHHPVRCLDKSMKTHAHGFLNLFVAAVLAAAQKLEEEQVRKIIEDEDPSHFVFDEGGLRWQDLSASLADITSCREQFATAFGSCSFDEPREDLRALNLLE